MTNEVIHMLKDQQYPKRLTARAVRPVVLILLTAALVLAAPAVGFAGKKPAFKTGNYIGHTSQGEPIVLVVKPKVVKRLEVTLDVQCSNGQVINVRISGPGAPLHHGAFSFVAELSEGGHIHVDGKLKGATASGHASTKDLVGTPETATEAAPNCVASITWHARAN